MTPVSIVGDAPRALPPWVPQGRQLVFLGVSSALLLLFIATMIVGQVGLLDVGLGPPDASARVVAVTPKEDDRAALTFEYIDGTALRADRCFAPRAALREVRVGEALPVWTRHIPWPDRLLPACAALARETSSFMILCLGVCGLTMLALGVFLMRLFARQQRLYAEGRPAAGRVVAVKPERQAHRVTYEVEGEETSVVLADRDPRVRALGRAPGAGDTVYVVVDNQDARQRGVWAFR